MPQIEKSRFDLWKGLIIAIGIFTFVVAVGTFVLWRRSKALDARIARERKNLDACEKAGNDPELRKLVSRARKAILRPDQGKVESVQSFLSGEAKSQQLFLKNIKPTEDKKSNVEFSKSSWAFEIRNRAERKKLTNYLYNVQTKKPGLIIEEITWELDSKAINKWKATIKVSTFVRKAESG